MLLEAAEPTPKTLWTTQKTYNANVQRTGELQTRPQERAVAARGARRS